jgi:hypothetical protein
MGPTLSSAKRRMSMAPDSGKRLSSAIALLLDRSGSRGACRAGSLAWGPGQPSRVVGPGRPSPASPAIGGARHVARCSGRLHRGAKSRQMGRIGQMASNVAGHIRHATGCGEPSSATITFYHGLLQMACQRERRGWRVRVSSAQRSGVGRHCPGRAAVALAGAQARAGDPVAEALAVHSLAWFSSWLLRIRC